MNLKFIKHIFLFFLFLLLGIQNTYAKTELILTKNNVYFSTEKTQGFTSSEKEVHSNIGFLKEKCRFVISEGFSAQNQHEFSEYFVKDVAKAGGKIKTPTQLAGKLGAKTSKLDNWLVKYADDLGDDATKLLDDLKDNIGNKQVLEVLEDAQGRLTVVAKGDGITNDVISLQKNVDGNYVNVAYNRAYNPTANMDIDVALSKNKLVPDYTKTQAGVLNTKYLYPKNLLPKGKSPVVRIKMTGKRRGTGGDFDLANQGIPQNIHGKITGQQNALYSAWKKANPDKKLSLDEMTDIEIQSMVNSGIPEDIATGWVVKSIEDLKLQGVTEIKNIPWNGVN